ncbi:MAG TPA: PQQ-binding-like beta-propeller repeat protein, partial [Candidatus Dormibacteraeota bacterium]
MRSQVARIVALPVVALAFLTAGGSAAAATTLWPMYHFDPGRSGYDTGEPSFRNLSSAWNSAPLDGAIFAEPLISGNSVIVATENNSLYAFNVADGGLQWGPVSLGTPRTSNFPCGNIMPLGVTGTPVIDGGWLYVLAEVENPAGTYRFHLAEVSPANGAIAYNRDVTPAGMDTNVQQERGALAVSGSNVVVVWGGMAGDCGAYHGYVETIAKATGAPQAQWNDTPSGTEGGMWAPSGPAVDGAGNIYISTGNGSSSNINNYDFGNSVLKFSPALGLQSWFAPGAPVNWASLSASDTDLGSVGPSLLPNGRLFAIGKGGRGYLLNQAQLPNNSNPGGGENFGAQVCNATADAAFGGLAVVGNLVFVPCADGIAEVSIDSATSFHRVWYTRSGGSAPIFAGGLLWTVGMFGGSTLYGMDTSGTVVSQLSLPATTQHFATPAAGQQRLFVPAGNRLAAFAPPAPPPAPVAGGYLLDGYGGVHPYGGASFSSASAYHPGWDIARGIVMRPDRASGYVLDGYGGVAPFGLAAAPLDNAYWPGWDIARAIALNPCDGTGNSGYTLDGWGGVHPFGAAPALDGVASWPGWDIARGLALSPCTGGVVSGYTLDGWGGVHPFWQHGTPALMGPTNAAYWRGWDIARGIVVTSAGAGYTLDGWGGVHPFGSGTANISFSGYSPSRYARAITYAPSLGGGYTLDAYGGLHPWWMSGHAPIADP